MKNIFSKTGLIIFLVLFVYSCRSSPEKTSGDNPNQCTEYACPMHPDKTAAEHALCPECKMKMTRRIKKGSICDTANTAPEK